MIKYTYMKTLQQRTQEAIDAGYTVGELSKATGKSSSAASQWLSGQTKALKADTAAGLEQLTGWNAAWWATGKGDRGEGKQRVGPEGQANAVDASAPRFMRPTPVIGTAKLGDDGEYEQLTSPDGWVDGYSADLDAYALRVRGDSMHPAIRHGSFVVVEPGGRCVPGEYVAIALTNGCTMVKELVIERSDEIVVESVNGNHRRTIDRCDLVTLHPVAAVVAASKWVAGRRADPHAEAPPDNRPITPRSSARHITSEGKDAPREIMPHQRRFGDRK